MIPETSMEKERHQFSFFRRARSSIVPGHSPSNAQADQRPATSTSASSRMRAAMLSNQAVRRLLGGIGSSASLSPSDDVHVDHRPYYTEGSFWASGKVGTGLQDGPPVL